MSKHRFNRHTPSAVDKINKVSLRNDTSNLASAKQRLSRLNRLAGSLWLVPLLSGLVVFVVAEMSLRCFPHTQSLMEAVNYYVATDDFILGRLADYPGANNLFVSWLLQFFADPAVGTFLESLLLALIAVFASLVVPSWFGAFDKEGRGGVAKGLFMSLNRSRRFPSFLFATVIPLALLVGFIHRIGLSIEAIFVFASLCVIGFTRAKCRWPWSWLVVVLTGFLAFWIVSFPVLLLLMLLIVLLQALTMSQKGLEKRSKAVMIVETALPLLIVALTVLGVKLSSDHLGFIPFGERWWHIDFADGREHIYLLMLGLPVSAMLFLPRLRNVGAYLLSSIFVVLVVGCVCYSEISGNEQYRLSEDVYRRTALAEESRWAELLDDVKQKGTITNNIDLQFALLAEARLGTLPETLFSYPINSPELFCPRFDGKPFATDFCRIFYRELGVCDEAFHQAFEYGMKISPSSGMCLSSLRHMVEYSVMSGDKAAARKYLALLKETSCHDDFVSLWNRKINELQVTPCTADRSNNFIKAFHFNSEMAHLLDFDKDNRAVLDYLLCGLLLTKQLELFKTVLSDYAAVYHDSPLPKAYAEAAAMIERLRPGIWGGRISYDPKYDTDFARFTILQKEGGDTSAFVGTFWYYYVNAEIPPLRDWQQIGHDTTS